MTLNELIESLEDLKETENAGDLEVQFAYDYGDYFHTKVSAAINDIEIEYVKYAYEYDGNKVVSEEDKHAEKVIIIS